MKPCLILIAGPSGCGKSTLAQALSQALGSDRSQLLALDHYYRDLQQLTAAQRAQHNFDEPKAWQWERLQQDLRQLCLGQAIDRPEYDFQTHLRKKNAVRVDPSAYIIAEGLFALCDPSVNALAQLRIFVDIEDEPALQRRLQRDTRERGRSHSSVVEQYERCVRPANRLYIHPSRSAANCLLQGSTPTAEQLANILAQLPPQPAS